MVVCLVGRYLLACSPCHLHGSVLNNPTMNTTWFLVAYLLLLIFLAVKRDKFSNAAALRPAWISFALIPVSYFVFCLFRAGNIGNARDMALIETWANGIEWLLLGISMLFLTGMLAPHPGFGSYSGESSRSVPPAP